MKIINNIFGIPLFQTLKKQIFLNNTYHVGDGIKQENSEYMHL